MYKKWVVNGISSIWDNDRPKMKNTRFFVQYTSDKFGKTLSIGDEQTGVNYQIPAERVIKEILEAENAKE